jgi:hypothetical protein
MFDKDWFVVGIPFACAAMLSPFAAYLLARWRRNHP